MKNKYNKIIFTILSFLLFVGCAESKENTEKEPQLNQVASLEFSINYDEASPIYVSENKLYFVMDSLSDTPTSYATESIGFFDLQKQTYQELLNFNPEEAIRIYRFIDFGDSLLYVKLDQIKSSETLYYEIIHYENDKETILMSGVSTSYFSMPEIMFDKERKRAYFISTNNEDSEKACLNSFDSISKELTNLECYTIKTDDQETSSGEEFIERYSLNLSSDYLTYITYRDDKSIINETNLENFDLVQYSSDFYVSRAISLDDSYVYEYAKDEEVFIDQVSKKGEKQTVLNSFFNRYALFDNNIYFVPDSGDNINVFNEKSTNRVAVFEGYEKDPVNISMPYIFKTDSNQLLIVNNVSKELNKVQIFEKIPIK